MHHPRPGMRPRAAAAALAILLLLGACGGAEDSPSGATSAAEPASAGSSAGAASDGGSSGTGASGSGASDSGSAGSGTSGSAADGTASADPTADGTAGSGAAAEGSATSGSAAADDGASAAATDPYPVTPPATPVELTSDCTGEGMHRAALGAAAEPALPERAAGTLVITFTGVESDGRVDLTASIGGGAARPVAPAAVGDTVAIDQWTISMTSICEDAVEFDLIG